ncbi:MAG: hypothetical protein FWB94_11845 [Chitinispirillia bacterium]|nr:hypothetical protein [Chitinispirillia bacterium]
MGIGKIRIMTALIALLSCALFAESGAGGINFALPNVSSGLFLDWGAAAKWSDIAYVNKLRDGGTHGFQPCRGECEPPGFWARAIPATLYFGYMGYTVAARDYVYRDNPEDNWIGAVNGFCTGFILGVLSSAWLESVIVPDSGLWGATLITVAGVAAGWWLAGYKEKINKNPFMYYGVAVPVLVPLFMITMSFAFMI